jgi:hypothetical protein
MTMSSNLDGIRTAAAVLIEEVAELAIGLAGRLRSEAALAPGEVAELMCQARRIQVRLEKHQARLVPAREEAQP